MEITKEQWEARQKAINAASAFINSNKFDENSFDQNYNKGASADNVHFGYHFGLECANMLTMKSQSDIRKKTPNLLKILSRLNDSEFEFALQCFKNRMNIFNPYFSQSPKFFDTLIKESVANTELENNPVIQNIEQASKGKVIKNIGDIRENSVLKNANKLNNI